MQHAFLGFFLLILTSAVASCGKGDPAESRHFYDTLQVDGRTRTYLLNLPPEYKTVEGMALVIALHGFGGDAGQMENDYQLSRKSDAAGFVVVYPEGVPNDGPLGLRNWNAGTCCAYSSDHNVDDVKFISRLMQKLTARYNIDARKTYAVGMSNGGMMTYRLACELPGQLAAVAVVSGALMTAQPCQPSRPVPILHIHSSLDVKVPYHGGTGLGGYHYPPVDSALSVWAGNNKCGSQRTVLLDTTLYTHSKWEDCEGNTTVESYITKDGGHSWPGGQHARPAADMPSAAINATDVIWDFLQRYSL